MGNLNEFPPDWQRDEFMGLNSALERAAHIVVDSSPKIFVDPLVTRVIGTEAEAWFQSNLASFRSADDIALRAAMMVRNRYTEDELLISMHKGVRQYLILGAGLDTFALRTVFSHLRVFEVDHPATQAWKRSCLEKAGIPIPRSVSYVSVDFERQNIVDALREVGFKTDEPAFVSFIGVARYLSRDAVMSVFRSIASLPADSEVIFDCALPPSLLQVLRGRALPGCTQISFNGSPLLSVLRRLREAAYRTIVNWKFKDRRFRPSYFDLPSLARDLKRMGFSVVRFVGPKEMNHIYCGHRTDGLRIQNQMHLVTARV